MSEIQMPTCGRIVHYYPMNCNPSTNNGIIKLPAIVICDDLNPDLNVHYASERNPVKTFRSIPHKNDWVEGQVGYWDWPARN